MNDQLSGQLGWSIPNYAREALWIEGETDAVRLEGAQGLFTLDTPAQVLTLRWGGEAGAALARLRWQPDSLDWDGVVRVGGYIDAMHVTEIDGLPAPIVILSVGGQPLKVGSLPYPPRAERLNAPYPVPSFHDGIDDGIDESVTTWMAFEDSPALMLAQDALVSKLPIYCTGRLAAQAAGWHAHFALPLALEGMSLFAG